MPKSGIILNDGTTLEGAIMGIDNVAVSIAGGQALTLDLGKAKSVEFAMPPAPNGLDCTLVARTNDREVACSTSHVSFVGAKPLAPALPGPLVIEPPSLGAKMAVKKLPDVASDICVGGGGRFLVLHLPKLNKLAVFDASEAAIVRYIPVNDPGSAFFSSRGPNSLSSFPKAMTGWNCIILTSMKHSPGQASIIFWSHRSRHPQRSAGLSSPIRSS